jgi:hypothetical protein
MVDEKRGRVIDMVIWESAAQARNSSRRLMSELAHSPVHDVIDQNSVFWSIGSVFHRLP